MYVWYSEKFYTKKMMLQKDLSGINRWDGLDKENTDIKIDLYGDGIPQHLDCSDGPRKLYM